MASSLHSMGDTEVEGADNFDMAMASILCLLVQVQVALPKGSLDRDDYGHHQDQSAGYADCFAVDHQSDQSQRWF